jgi:hypothetical protein
MIGTRDPIPSRCLDTMQPEYPFECNSRQPARLRRLSGAVLLPLAVWAVWLTLASASHAQTGPGSPERARAQAVEIRKEYRKGPVRLRVIVDKDNITIAEGLTLTIEADAEEGYEVELPPFGDKLGDFGIVDYRQEPPVLTSEGRILSRKIYKLEPFLSGEYKIAPMSVKFRKKPDASGQQDDLSDHEIATEELLIKVRSLLGEDRSEHRFHPIFGPVELPARPIPILYGAIAAAVLLLGGTAGYFCMKRRRTKAAESAPPSPAHELAYGQLQDIFDAKLLERGEFKLFFARISDVIRFYVENRFGLHAPKLTTEEFLSSVRRDPPFESDYARLLDEFLRHCDLVKFAEHRPEPSEAREVIDACKAFIEATKVESPSVGVVGWEGEKVRR